MTTGWVGGRCWSKDTKVQLAQFSDCPFFKKKNDYLFERVTERETQRHLLAHSSMAATEARSLELQPGLTQVAGARAQGLISRHVDLQRSSWDLLPSSSDMDEGDADHSLTRCTTTPGPGTGFLAHDCYYCTFQMFPFFPF